VERISTNYDTQCHKANESRHDKTIFHSYTLLDLKLHFLHSSKLSPEYICNSNMIFIPLRSVEVLKDEECKHEVMQT